MAKKRSVGVEETENKARAEIWLALHVASRGRLKMITDEDDINGIFRYANDALARSSAEDLNSFSGGEPLRALAAYQLERSVPAAPW